LIGRSESKKKKKDLIDLLLDCPMAGQNQRLNVVPTVTMLGVMKARLVGATRGHALLKKKSDALTVQFRSILKKIVTAKESMGDAMRSASFSLAEAKYVAGDGVKYVVRESVKSATLRVRSIFIPLILILLLIHCALCFSN
jgi:V-type H+-transporting ATPase subunit D